MKCINCRCVIPDTSDYCVYCGYAVKTGKEPTYPVSYADYEATVPEATVLHSLAARDDPNQFYGIPEENDGSDAYDAYYEADYPGYRPVEYAGAYNIAEYSGLDITKLLWCFAGLDFIIILLLLIILALLM